MVTCFRWLHWYLCLTICSPQSPVLVAVAPLNHRANVSVTPCVCTMEVAVETLTPSARKKVSRASERRGCCPYPTCDGTSPLLLSSRRHVRSGGRNRSKLHYGLADREHGCSGPRALGRPTAAHGGRRPQRRSLQRSTFRCFPAAEERVDLCVQR